jgi:hypothetical protein
LDLVNWVSTHLSLGQLRLDVRPGLTLGSIAEKVHDDGTTRDSLIDIEEVGSRNPTILNSLLPRSTVLPNTDDDVQTVVTEVETLTVALGTVADESKSVVLEVFLQSSIRRLSQ